MRVSNHKWQQRVEHNGTVNLCCVIGYEGASEPVERFFVLGVSNSRTTLNRFVRMVTV